MKRYLLNAFTFGTFTIITLLQVYYFSSLLSVITYAARVSCLLEHESRPILISSNITILPSFHWVYTVMAFNVSVTVANGLEDKLLSDAYRKFRPALYSSSDVYKCGCTVFAPFWRQTANKREILFSKVVWSKVVTVDNISTPFQR